MLAVHSIILMWPDDQLTSFILDPMSLFNDADISPHNNLKNDLFKFAQDFTYSLHRQRQTYFGEWIKPWQLQTNNGIGVYYVYSDVKINSTSIIFVSCCVTGSCPLQDYSWPIETKYKIR